MVAQSFNFMVKDAIYNGDTAKGASRPAIKQHLKSKFKVNSADAATNSHIKRAIETGLEKGEFTWYLGHAGGHLKLTQDAKKKFAKEEKAGTTTATKPASKKVIPAKAKSTAAKKPKTATKPASKKAASSTTKAAKTPAAKKAPAAKKTATKKPAAAKAAPKKAATKPASTAKKPASSTKKAPAAKKTTAAKPASKAKKAAPKTAAKKAPAKKAAAKK